MYDALTLTQDLGRSIDYQDGKLFVVATQSAGIPRVRKLMCTLEGRDGVVRQVSLTVDEGWDL